MKPIRALQLEPRGGVPNNPRLPVLIYEAAFLPATGAIARQMEQRFAENGWPPQWRNGIYAFHHYHAEGHEVLGIAAGHAVLIIGGDGGEELRVSAGDVLVLPAGTGHCRRSASADLLVVGAYPSGQQGDILREAASPDIRGAIDRLPFPRIDPVLGRDGPLVDHWLANRDG